MDLSAYLRTKFGAGPFGPYLRSLRVMLKTFDEAPDYAALSRLLQPLSTGELTSIATLVSYELPPPKWSASTRSSLVVAALARVLASIFQAALQLSTEAARVAAEGGGGGGGFGHGGAAEEPSPSLSDSAPDRQNQYPTPPSPVASVTARSAPRQESTRGIAFRRDIARQVQQMRARCWGKFPGTYALLVARGVYPETPVSLLDWDVEVLLGIKEALEAESLAIELLLKSTFDSDPGTSIATSKAMDVITDPDSAFEAYLRSGEVSLSDLSPVERLGGFGPFAVWTSKACSQYFYGEALKTAAAMFAFVKKELTFLAPNGALSIHPGYTALSKNATLTDLSFVPGTC